MKTLVTAHRKAVNRAAHAAAVRFETETRSRWLQELTAALEAGASFVELQRLIAQLTPFNGEHLDSVICVADWLPKQPLRKKPIQTEFRDQFVTVKHKKKKG